VVPSQAARPSVPDAQHVNGTHCTLSYRSSSNVVHVRPRSELRSCTPARVGRGGDEDEGADSDPGSTEESEIRGMRLTLGGRARQESGESSATISTISTEIA